MAAVVLILVAVAAPTFTLTPAQAAAFDTQTYFDVDNDDAATVVGVTPVQTTATALDGQDSTTSSIVSTGSTAAAGTANSLEFVAQTVGATGLDPANVAIPTNVQVTTTAGFIGAATGPKVVNLGVVIGDGDANADETLEATAPIQIFGGGGLGAATITADLTGGAGANISANLVLVGPIGSVTLAWPVPDRLLGAADAGTLGEVGNANATIDALGAGDCGGAVCVGLSVVDNLGIAYPDGIPVVWQSSNLAAGAFTFGGLTAQTGAIRALNAIGGGDDGNLEPGETAISGFTAGATPGQRTTITATIGGVSTTLEVIVHGTIAALQLAVAHVGSSANAGADLIGVVAGGPLFALGLVDTTTAGVPPTGAGGVISQDLALVTVTATDAAGQPAESGTVPLLTDTADLASLFAAGGAGVQADGGDENNPIVAISTANSLTAGATNGQTDAVIDAGAGSAGAVSFGTHPLQANLVIGATDIRSNTVNVLVSDLPAFITQPQFTINTAQGVSLAPGQTATVTVSATDAAGRVVPDGTQITFNSTGGAVWTNGAAAFTPAPGTSNGAVSAVLLPTGTALSATVTAFSTVNAAVAASNTIQMVQQPAGLYAPASVAVGAGATTLVVGESTTVTATVFDQDGAPMPNQNVRFTEGVATATIDGSVKLTNADGRASATFTAGEPGGRRIAATVVNINGPVIVETAVGGFVDITVTPAPPPPVRELRLRAGGQFLFWQFATATASEVFGALKIAWLFDQDELIWTAYIPALGITDFDVDIGAILWLVSDVAQRIVF